MDSTDKKSPIHRIKNKEELTGSYNKCGDSDNKTIKILDSEGRDQKEKLIFVLK